ncbi:DoxX family protein [Actinokineospora sp. G85]|uniref:DoxX family protein n=1 Tax=Actinokineospora sp. G85 TaxID=3406626 RepID=UPI003C70FDDC
MSTDDFHRSSDASKTSGSGYDTVAYETGPTTAFAAPGAGDGHDDGAHADPAPRRTPHQWTAGLDLGLLVLRVTVGALFVAHGLQKVFGLLGGPGISGFADALGGYGFTRPTLLAWITGITELGAGGLLVLGLFTPAAAAGVLGVMANAIYLNIDLGAFAGGVEKEVVFAAAAFALLFAGAGRISIDKNTPWCRKPLPFGLVFLLIAAGLSVVTLVVLR